MNAPYFDANDAFAPTASYGFSVSSASIVHAKRLAETTGVLDMVNSWLSEDWPTTNYGKGRPSTLDPNTFLLALFACVFEGGPVSLRRVHALITHANLSKPDRHALGLPVSGNHVEDAVYNESRQGISYAAVGRISSKVCATFDPQPYPRKRGMTKEELDDIAATWKPEAITRRQVRADVLAWALCTAALCTLPATVLSKWNGALSADGTIVPIFGKGGHDARSRRCMKGDSTEPNGGWHAKTDPKRAGANSAPRKANDEYTFGYDGHLAACTGPGATKDFPILVVAGRIDRPGFAPGLNIADILRPFRAAGWQAGTLVCDMGMTQLPAAKFAKHTHALGYDLVMDYKVDQLGLQDVSEAGTLHVEGTDYGPCLPRALQNASIDFRAGIINRATYKQRLKARELYRMRQKSVRVVDGQVVSRQCRCPAQQTGATVVCPLQPDQPMGTAGLPRVTTAPKNPPAVCRSKSSTTIPAEFAERYRQPVPFESPDWYAIYKRDRAIIESQNRKLKVGSGASIANADHRRVRGMGAQMLVLFAKIGASNMVVTDRFLASRKDLVGPARAPGHAVPAEQWRDVFAALAVDGPLRITGRTQFGPLPTTAHTQEDVRRCCVSCQAPIRTPPKSKKNAKCAVFSPSTFRRQVAYLLRTSLGGPGGT